MTAILRPVSLARQRGVALLVTLVILVIVTFMGLVAMRSGMLQVAIATNSQVNSLLFQNAESGVEAVRQLIEADVEAAALPTGVIGLATNQPTEEVAGCRHKTAGLHLSNSTTTPTAESICSPSVSGEYFSARGAVQVQVAVSAVLDAAGQPMVMVTDGMELCSTKECEGPRPLSAERSVMAVYSTAVMPTFGSTESQVQDCLEDYKQSRGAYTVTDCLTDVRAAFRTVVQEYAFGRSGY
jgi:Tfp pilus assembly protein PilX